MAEQAQEQRKQERDESRRELQQEAEETYRRYCEIESRLYQDKLKRKMDKEAQIRERIKEEAMDAYFTGWVDAARFYEAEAKKRRTGPTAPGDSSASDGRQPDNSSAVDGSRVGLPGILRRAGASLSLLLPQDNE